MLICVYTYNINVNLISKNTNLSDILWWEQLESPVIFQDAIHAYYLYSSHVVGDFLNCCSHWQSPPYQYLSQYLHWPFPAAQIQHCPLSYNDMGDERMSRLTFNIWLVLFDVIYSRFITVADLRIYLFVCVLSAYVSVCLQWLHECFCLVCTPLSRAIWIYLKRTSSWV